MSATCCVSSKATLSIMLKSTALWVDQKQTLYTLAYLLNAQIRANWMISQDIRYAKEY